MTGGTLTDIGEMRGRAGAVNQQRADEAARLAEADQKLKLAQMLNQPAAVAKEAKEAAGLDREGSLAKSKRQPVGK